MAQRTQTILTDDLEGGEAPASDTITFALDGTSYEIDLNETHAARLRQEFSIWTGAARKATGRSGARAGRPRARSAGGRGDTSAVRTWARENGYQVSDRGRVPSSITEAYDAAHA